MRFTLVGTHDFRREATVGYALSVAWRGHAAGDVQDLDSTQEFTVAAVCDICDKKPGFGNNRPWSRKITKRRFDPNIQRVRAVINGTPKRLNVCTSCLKAGKVSR